MYKQQKDHAHDGYYKIHNHKKFSVSRLGSVIHSESGNILTRRYDEDTELYLMDASKYGVMLPPLHCILAETFVIEPEDIVGVDRFYKRVKFIDGNSNNLNVKNLKWVLTEKGILQKKLLKANIKKKYRPGTAILTKNIKTGEIRKFVSTAEFSDETAITSERINNYLRTPPVNVIKTINGCMVKYDDGSYWPTITSNTVIEEFPTHVIAGKRAIIVTDKEGKETEYTTIVNMAKALNLSAVVVGQQLKRSKLGTVIHSSGAIIKYKEIKNA